MQSDSLRRRQEDRCLAVPHVRLCPASSARSKSKADDVGRRGILGPRHSGCTAQDKTRGMLRVFLEEHALLASVRIAIPGAARPMVLLGKWHARNPRALRDEPILDLFVSSCRDRRASLLM